MSSCNQSQATSSKNNDGPFQQTDSSSDGSGGQVSGQDASFESSAGDSGASHQHKQSPSKIRVYKRGTPVGKHARSTKYVEGSRQSRPLTSDRSTHQPSHSLHSGSLGNPNIRDDDCSLQVSQSSPWPQTPTQRLEANPFTPYPGLQPSQSMPTSTQHGNSASEGEGDCVVSFADGLKIGQGRGTSSKKATEKCIDSFEDGLMLGKERGKRIKRATEREIYETGRLNGFHEGRASVHREMDFQSASMAQMCLQDGHSQGPSGTGPVELVQ